MYLVAHGVKKRLQGATASGAPCSGAVSRPHGAESGFDPYQAYKDLDEESVFGFTNGVMLKPGVPDYVSHVRRLFLSLRVIPKCAFAAER